MASLRTEDAGDSVAHPAGETHELTHGQLLLWAGQQLQPDDPLYNMVLVFRIRGPVDVDAFRAAFQRLVDRSDAMRAVVTEAGDAPRQRFAARAASSLEVLDFSESPDAEAELRAWAQARCRRRLDLGQCMYDAALVRLGGEDFAWYFNQHHLITDAWSIAVIYERVSRYYALAREGRPDAGPEPPQFRDYVAREALRRGSARLEKARAFWRGRVEAPAAGARFYGAAARTPSGRTERVRCSLGVARSARIREVAGRAPFRAFTADMAQFRFFATVLIACLRRLGGQRELSVGVPAHNRDAAALKRTAGLFIELYPLRVDVGDEDSLRSLAEKVAAESNSVLLNALPGAMGFEHRGAYDVVLNYITASFGDFDGMPVESEWVHPGYGDRDHRLRLQVQDFDRAAEFQLHFDVSEECFSPAMRGWLVEHFVRTVDAFLDDPEQRVDAVALLDADSARRQLDAMRAPPAPLPRETVVELFACRVVRHPDSAALLEGERRLTYGELDAASGRVAAALAARGAGRGSFVAIALPRSIEAVIAIFGAMKAGAAYLPVEVEHPRERIRHLLEDSGARLVLTSPGVADVVGPAGADVLHIEDALAASAPPPACAPALDDPAYLVYTSGSTGSPKGVVVRHRSLSNYVQWAAGEYAADEGSSFPLFSPLSFDLTVTSLFVPLVTGGTIVVYGAGEGRRELTIRHVVTDNRVDVVKLTPVHLQLVRDMDFASSRIRTLVVGGEDFPVELARSVHRRFGGEVAIYNEYGPTEGTVACAIHRFDPETDVDASVPIGRAIRNLEVYVLDAAGNVLPPGVAGEICIGGAGVAAGYHGKPQATAERFVANPFRAAERMYRSGDLARVNAGGVMHYLGRTDEQVKVRGVRIETAEVEAALQAHEAVTQCVVGVYEDAPRVSGAAEGPSCQRCGLEGAHPEADLDAGGVCRLCRDYDAQSAPVAAYFGDDEELRAIVERIKREAGGEHDCMMLLSGGKDSTYALCQIVEMGLRPLVFTLDNGFISDGAKANMRRVVDKYGLDLVVGGTPAMNEIFVESLNRFSNVCNGCFKTIYTLGMNLARERGIRTIITGLSRGQIFDTRLAGLRQQEIGDRARVDRTIVEARKAYHRMDDVVSRCLDVSHFADDGIFEAIEFVDFYRYCEATLDEMLDYLAREAPWIRPADTGRSTNCLINEAGIHVHKTERGYHNYALPYSWDVRLGHKQRDAAAAELRDDIDVDRVNAILDEVGYELCGGPGAASGHRRLAAWYVAATPVSAGELREWLEGKLPAEYVPSSFVALDALPLTPNDKVDRAALPRPDAAPAEAPAGYVAPSTATERLLADIWAEVLGAASVGAHDDFFDLGGDSILNIQIVTRARERGVVVTPQQIFDRPTVAALAEVASTGAAGAAPEGPLEGEVRLTPVQQRFFAEFRADLRRYAQDALLDLRAPYERATLEQALALLVARHASLTSRFERDDNGNWTQHIQATGAVRIEVTDADLTGLDAPDEAAAIDELAAALSAQLEIETGECVRAAHVRRGGGRNDQLLIVVHHLVVDGVSWWVLARELGAVLEPLAAGRTPELPPRSSSWRRWSDALTEHARSAALRREARYWTGPVAPSTSLPPAPRVASPAIRTVRATLDRDRTGRLLHEVPGALRVQVPDVLVAALVEASAEVAGGDGLRLEIETHGREELAAGLDLLRTVGWFTSIYPVSLRRDPAGGPLATLRDVKERLRSVPDRGVGYGLLRHGGADAEIARALAAQPPASAVFNYMGQWDRAAGAEATVGFARPIGLQGAGAAPWLAPLEIDAVVFEGSLVVEFRHGAGGPDPPAVDALAGRFIAVLEALVDARDAETGAALAPSDFPHADLDQGELDDILSELGEEG